MSRNLNDIDRYLKHLAAFSLGPLEPVGDAYELRGKESGILRLGVRRKNENGEWLGTIELVTDYNGNPISINIGLSLA